LKPLVGIFYLSFCPQELPLKVLLFILLLILFLLELPVLLFELFFRFVLLGTSTFKLVLYLAQVFLQGGNFLFEFLNLL